MDMDLREMTAANRRALADIFDGLSEQQWSLPSLCEGWSTKHVLAHVTMPFRMSTAAFALGMLRARGRFHELADRAARRDAVLPSAELIAAMRAAADRGTKLPGGYEGALTHDVVHGLDICRPLGVKPPIADDALRVVLDTLAHPKRTKYFGVDVQGLRLRADDLDWAYGTGDPMTAPAQDLVLLLTGRTGRDQAGR